MEWENLGLKRFLVPKDGKDRKDGKDEPGSRFIQGSSTSLPQDRVSPTGVNVRLLRSPFGFDQMSAAEDMDGYISHRLQHGFHCVDSWPRRRGTQEHATVTLLADGGRPSSFTMLHRGSTRQAPSSTALKSLR